jgi:hypothetical protein
MEAAAKVALGTEGFVDVGVEDGWRWLLVLACGEVVGAILEGG